MTVREETVTTSERYVEMDFATCQTRQHRPRGAVLLEDMCAFGTLNRFEWQQRLQGEQQPKAHMGEALEIVYHGSLQAHRVVRVNSLRDEQYRVQEPRARWDTPQQPEAMPVSGMFKGKRRPSEKKNKFIEYRPKSKVAAIAPDGTAYEQTLATNKKSDAMRSRKRGTGRGGRLIQVEPGTARGASAPGSRNLTSTRLQE